MTTNYRERLDEALIRPGRIDVQQRIGWCTEYQIKALFQNFYPDANADQRSQFAVTLMRNPDANQFLSPAKIQSYLMLHKSGPNEALANIQEWLKSKAVKDSHQGK